MISPFQVKIGKKSLPIINNVGFLSRQNKDRILHADLETIRLGNLSCDFQAASSYHDFESFRNTWFGTMPSIIRNYSERKRYCSERKMTVRRFWATPRQKRPPHPVSRRRSSMTVRGPDLIMISRICLISSAYWWGSCFRSSWISGSCEQFPSVCGFVP